MTLSFAIVRAYGTKRIHITTTSTIFSLVLVVEEFKESLTDQNRIKRIIIMYRWSHTAVVHEYWIVQLSVRALETDLCTIRWFLQQSTSGNDADIVHSTFRSRVDLPSQLDHCPSSKGGTIRTKGPRCQRRQR
jgi:hypothetical protein